MHDYIVCFLNTISFKLTNQLFVRDIHSYLKKTLYSNSKANLLQIL